MASLDWTIEPFDRKRHDRTDFDCGDPLLNDWIATKISQFERRDLARAYVLAEKNSHKVGGFYAISAHAISYKALPDDQAKGLPRMDVPALLLGKLAVERSLQGQGYGERLLVNALRHSEYLAKSIGIQTVEVTATNEAAKRFYERHGFVVLKDDPFHLLLPMKTIRGLKLQPL